MLVLVFWAAIEAALFFVVRAKPVVSCRSVTGGPEPFLHGVQESKSAEGAKQLLRKSDGSRGSCSFGCNRCLEMCLLPLSIGKCA